MSKPQDVSRQETRRDCFRLAVCDVNERNLAEVGKGHFRGMKRRERRALARAYAARYWRGQYGPEWRERHSK